MSTFPKVLPNGCKILKIFWSALTSDGVVLASHDKLSGRVEYVTWRFSREDMSDTHTGNYFGSPYDGAGNADLLEAHDDFRKRANNL